MSDMLERLSQVRFKALLSSARHTVEQIVYGAWFQGTNTLLSVAGGRARATSVGVSNPRISRHVTGLISGVTYSVTLHLFIGTIPNNMYARISADEELTLDDYGIGYTASNDATAVIQFVAPVSGDVYIGIVAVSSADGQYAEVDDIITVVRV